MGLFGKAVVGLMVYASTKRVVRHVNETIRLRKEAKES